MNNTITVISGATATGKTAYSIELANKLKNEGNKVVIINFDSLLFYKELNIGTAKPTKQEQGEITHEMIDICSAHTPINAHDYSVRALQHIKQYLQSSHKVLLVGGSGFYVRALIKGMYDSPPISEQTRASIEEIFQSKGIEGIRNILQKYDQESFANLHPNDHYRNIRALEHWTEHQTPISNQKKEFEANNPYDFSNNLHGWNINHHYLQIEKERHWQIIQTRAKQMITSGLVEEVQALLNDGFTGEEKPLQSIGYKETIDFLNNKIENKDDLIEKIYIATRRLAKAQKTFFKKVIPKEIILR